MPKPKIEFTPPKDWLSKKRVDGFSHSFEDLAKTRLPNLYLQLQTQIHRAIPLLPFAEDGNGPATLLSDTALSTHLKGLQDPLAEATRHTASLKSSEVRKNNRDFAGVYVMVSGKRPFYVGISRTAICRLRSHVRTLEHHTASLLFNLLKNHTSHNGFRGDLDFTTEEAKGVQRWLRSQKVAILPLACPVERYAFELYAAMKLETGKWNTFETH